MLVQVSQHLRQQVHGKPPETRACSTAGVGKR
jgi:hypothetical protein